MRKQRPLFGPALVALLVLSGAAEARIQNRPSSWDAPPPSPLPLGKPEAAFPVNVDWTLVEMNGKPVPGEAPSFVLDDKFRATGFSGCNTYSLTLFPIRGQKLAAGAIAMTRKACDKAEMLFEHSFLVGLHSVPTWSLEGDALVIKAPTATMRFRRGL